MNIGGGIGETQKCDFSGERVPGGFHSASAKQTLGKGEIPIYQVKKISPE